jgi:Uncharacterized conserved protein
VPKNYTIQEDVNADVISSPFQIPLHALHASRETYINYPDCQRQEVWPERYKKDLIDSLVKGLFIPEILLTNRMDGNPGKWVIDGQQRLQTVMQFFDALEADLRGEPIPKDEEGEEYFYFRLTESQEKRLRNRMIKFTELQNMTEELLTITFLRLQNQVSLSPAEKLWASRSQFRHVAAEVYNHRFYKEMYQGHTKRRQAFQMAIYPVIIEMFKPFADMNSARLRVLSGRVRDELIYPGMAEVIHGNIDLVTNLYDGIKPLSMTEMIIMYQSVWLLKFLGIDLTNSSHGALASWYSKTIVQDPKNHGKGGLSLFSQMTHYKVQREVWQKWLDEILYGNYINLGDETQKALVLAQLQRVTGWLRHDGICKACGNTHIRLVDIEKHLFRPADSHRPGNCFSISNSKALVLAPTGT